jgi:hypothetical protein
MSNFSTAVTVANEIVKAVDFTYAHDQTIQNVSVVLQNILADASFDLVIGGTVVPYVSGGMNVTIDPLYAHCRYSGIDVLETELQQPISIEPADATHDRIDVIQIRGIEESYDYQNRKFRDPQSGTETVQEIATKKRIKLDVVVKKGTNGSVVAPVADTGYVKLAEIVVLAGAVSITMDNIKNITGRYARAVNSGWTNENTRTFNPGYLTDIIGKFLVDHTEAGAHKANVIKAAMIKFGNESGDVNGGVMPVGLSLEITGQNFTALSALAQVMAALAAAVNLAYPYANNILAKYILIAMEPVAASTENVDVVTGGVMNIDGIFCSIGQMVFLKDQTDPKQNGFWEVQSGAWNRYNGFTSENPAAFDNKFIHVKNGMINGGKVFFMEQESDIGTDNLVFQESIFSPLDLSGKVLIRDINGRTIDDTKREQAIAETKLDLTSHADMIEGYGRDLLTVLGVQTIPAAMAEIRRRCNNNGEIDGTGIPDFRGIRIGDYIDGLDLSAIGAPTGGTAPQAWNNTYKNNRILVSGFNTFKGTGDTEVTKNHILFTFRNIVAKGRMNSSNTNAGGYPATELRTWLEGASGDGSGPFATGLKAAFGGNDPLLTIRKLLSNKGDWGWVSCTVWLPTEDEVFGESSWGEPTLGDGIKVHFPIYQESSIYRVKRYNGSRDWWWESSPLAASAANFTYVNNHGNANISYASAVGGCAPAFCVA